MALLDKCFCCRLVIAGGFLAVYLLIAYLIAFAFELLWILDALIALPTAAILLCAGYFTLAIFAALLIHGLATKTTICLMAWMFAVTILTFPEAGLVIYMSIQYWRIESLYGMTELACWLARILASVIALIIIQSLYSTWKEEEMVTKRLRDLSLTAVTIPRDANLGPLGNQFYQNNAYETSLEQLNVGIKRTTSLPQLWTGGVPNNIAAFPLPDGYQFCTTQSEFNASIFVPNFVRGGGELVDDFAGKKAQSLMDLRILEDHPIIEDKFSHDWQPWMSHSIARTTNTMVPHYALSLDRRMSPKMKKFASLDDLNETTGKNSHVIQHRTGFYAQPIPNYGVPIYYGPLDGPDFLIYKKQVDKLSSKNSLSNTSTDDVQKYRDVAL